MNNSLVTKLQHNAKETLDSLKTDQIADILEKANYAYFQSDKPLFTDDIYDKIREYLSIKFPNHPVLSRIGSALKNEKKQKLPYFMGSLNKIKDEGSALQKFKKTYGGSYIISDKLDGNSALYMVKDGKKSLWSRGDGSYGRNISNFIPYIRNLPNIKDNNQVSVRGEIIISKEDFDKVKAFGTNPRSIITGFLLAKEPHQIISKVAQFIAYELITPHVKPIVGISYLEDYGFKIVWNRKLDEDDMTKEYLISIFKDRKVKSIFEIDGLAVVHNLIHPRPTTNPKYAFAFKSIGLQMDVNVEVYQVEWNITKDKILAPVVLFFPTKINGANYNKVNGYNAKYIVDNKIGPGSKLVIFLSGDIIPIIRSSTPSFNDKPQLPKVNYKWNKSGINIKIQHEGNNSNDDDNPVAFKTLEYFFQNLDIQGLGPGTIKKLFDAGHKNPNSILNITNDDLLQIKGFKNKSAQKLLSAIKMRKSKKFDPLLLMKASNLFNKIPDKKIQIIIDFIPQIITKRYIPYDSELMTIKSIKQKTAELFISGIEKFWDFIDKNHLKCPDNNVEQLNDKDETVTNKISVDKNKLIKDYCDQWLKNKNIHPGNGQKIINNSLVYRLFEKECIEKKNVENIKKNNTNTIKISNFKTFVKKDWIEKSVKFSKPEIVKLIIDDIHYFIYHIKYYDTENIFPLSDAESYFQNNKMYTIGELWNSIKFFIDNSKNRTSKIFTDEKIITNKLSYDYKNSDLFKNIVMKINKGGFHSESDFFINALPFLIIKSRIDYPHKKFNEKFIQNKVFDILQ